LMAGGRRRTATLAALAALTASLTACASSSRSRGDLAPSPASRQAAPTVLAAAAGRARHPAQALPARAGVSRAIVPHFQHVVIVLESNRTYSEVALSPHAPYLTSLAAAGVRLTNSHAVSQDARTGYLALFSGSTSSADRSCRRGGSPTLASELRAAGRSFAVYAQPHSAAGISECADVPCARRQALPVDPASGAGIDKSFAAFPRHWAKLPAVSFVIPGPGHDMGNGSIANGDAWLSKNLGAYAQWSVRHHSLLVVTFLNGDPSSRHVLTVLSGADLLPGTDGSPITPYSLLRTIEDAYGLRPLGRSAAARPIAADWQI
jgi:hypothetical protein